MKLYLCPRCRLMVKDKKPISTRKMCVEILKVRKQELLALVADADSYYTPYTTVKKRSDGSVKERRIEPSTGYLKKVQRRIDRAVLKPPIEGLPEEIMGGRRGFSVIRNARHHIDSRALMKYDVKNFFPSIRYEHVYYIYRYRLNYCEEAANILTRLTTYPSGSDAHVPQGAPTSTSLAILALEKMCEKLKSYVDEHGLKFSIWVDDITISGEVDQLSKCRHDIDRIVNSTPFTIHPEKDTGIIKKGAKHGKEKGRRITGIVLDNNNRLTLGKRKLKYLKKKLKNIKVPNQRLAGSLLFLKQVSPTQGKKLYHDYQIKTKKK